MRLPASGAFSDWASTSTLSHGRSCTTPWEKLHYDPKLYAYRTEVTEAELQDAPSLPHDADREREDMLRAYWALGPYGL